ncbi:hypothetical protein [Kitasatospora sp. NPDC087315]|uniref:hypothetical protein n=1 Tax=Kitasatospora sp. NPDC087315 TaxID=3364069 RepID=UPI00382CF99F
MYITLDEINTVHDFVAARLTEHSRALADVLGEDHPALDLARALEATARAARAGAVVLPLGASTTDSGENVDLGAGSIGWDLLAAAARTWRTHPDYPAAADRNFHDILHAELQAVVEQARPSVQHSFELTSKAGDLRLEYTNSVELEWALRRGLEASAPLCGLADCCTTVLITTSPTESAASFNDVRSARISVRCNEPRCTTQQAAPVVASS